MAAHPEMMFQQNNARPHTARITKQFLEQNNIDQLPWTSMSPDLNPIEHLWDQLGERIDATLALIHRETSLSYFTSFKQSGTLYHSIGSKRFSDPCEDAVLLVLQLIEAILDTDSVNFSFDECVR